jgi:hypothetical protein
MGGGDGRLGGGDGRLDIGDGWSESMMASFDREREVPRRRRPSRTRGEGLRVARGKESRGIVGSGRMWAYFLNFTKSKWQTIGESLFFHLAYILRSCQITRFAK